MPSGRPLGIDSFGSNVRGDRGDDSSQPGGCQGRIESWSLVGKHLASKLSLRRSCDDRCSLHGKPGCGAFFSTSVCSFRGGLSPQRFPEKQVKLAGGSPGATLPTNPPPPPSPSAFPLLHSCTPGIIFKLVVGQQNVYVTKNRSTQITSFV